MRVLVCGATYFLDYEKLHDKLIQIIIEKGLVISDIVIISGLAKGADTLAVKFAEQYNLVCVKFPADWNRYGKGAGPIRNLQMLDEGKPDLVVAFPLPGSKGTWDMINKSRFEGVEIIVFE